jgi:hypothetical protein
MTVMKKLNVLTVAVLLSTGAYALTPQEIDAAAREAQKVTGQEQQRQDAERLRRDGQKAPTGSNLKAASASAIPSQIPGTGICQLESSDSDTSGHGTDH